MKPTLVFAIALSFAAFGCKKKGGDCAGAINHSMELSKATMAKMGTDDKMMAKMIDVGIKHCSDDKWPDEVLKCMSDAKTETEAQACYGKLTAEQREKMNKAAAELMTPPAGSAAPPTGDTGSAATGSAATP